MFVKTCKNNSTHAIVGIASSSPYFSKVFEVCGNKESDMMLILYLKKKVGKEEDERAELIAKMKTF